MTTQDKSPTALAELGAHLISQLYEARGNAPLQEMIVHMVRDEIRNSLLNESGAHGPGPVSDEIVAKIAAVGVAAIHRNVNGKRLSESQHLYVLEAARASLVGLPVTGSSNSHRTPVVTADQRATVAAALRGGQATEAVDKALVEKPLHTMTPEEFDAMASLVLGSATTPKRTSPFFSPPPERP